MQADLLVDVVHVGLLDGDGAGFALPRTEIRSSPNAAFDILHAANKKFVVRTLQKVQTDVVHQGPCKVSSIKAVRTLSI